MFMRKNNTTIDLFAYFLCGDPHYITMQCICKCHTYLKLFDVKRITILLKYVLLILAVRNDLKVKLINSMVFAENAKVQVCG